MSCGESFSRRTTRQYFARKSGGVATPVRLQELLHTAVVKRAFRTVSPRLDQGYAQGSAFVLLRA